MPPIAWVRRGSRGRGLVVLVELKCSQNEGAFRFRDWRVPLSKINAENRMGVGRKQKAEGSGQKAEGGCQMSDAS